MLEIGSEFHMPDWERLGNALPDWLCLGRDRAFVGAGRTAIETVLQDLQGVASVALLPAYCCSSMIEPFEKAGFILQFYNVEHGEHGIRINVDNLAGCDVMLRCNYFGFQTDYPEEALMEFRQRGGIIIEDITHSILSKQVYHQTSDYLVASLRKWGALLDGGICCKCNGNFGKKPDKEPTPEFLNIKRSAMKQKTAYLRGEAVDKAHFLKLFRESNQWIEKHYSNMEMDRESKDMLFGWDVDVIREQRRENARALYKGIKNIDWVQPLFAEEQMDCPLFFPVFVRPDKREKLLKKLIAADVYCTIHWPKPPYGCESGLYEQELSLICDQRYSREDMRRIVSIIRD